MKRLLLTGMLLAACLSLSSCKGSKVLLRSDYHSSDTARKPSALLPAAGGEVAGNGRIVRAGRDLHRPCSIVVHHGTNAARPDIYSNVFHIIKVVYSHDYFVTLIYEYD